MLIEGRQKINKIREIENGDNDVEGEGSYN